MRKRHLGVFMVDNQSRRAVVIGSVGVILQANAVATRSSPRPKSRYTSHREISHRALAYVMDRCGLPYTQDQVIRLVSQIETLKPLPDVPAALETPRAAGYALAILSNGDRDMLEAAMPHVGIPFDHVISVQEAGAFKPHWRTYAKAAEIVDVDRTACILVANHAFDCIGANAYGMRTVFIDRRSRPFGETPHQPDLIVEDAAALATALA